MFEQILQQIGLTPNESKIYEALLNTKSASVSTIAIKAKVHRRNVYDSINKLMEKGLVSEIILDKEKHFKAVNPNRLSSILKDKEMNLNSALPEMKKHFQEIETKESVFIYKGIKGFRNYLMDVLDVGKPVYSLGAKGLWWDKRIAPLRIRFYKELEKRKLNGPEIFDHDMQFKMPEVIQAHKKQCKFFPKEYNTKSAIDFFGDHVCIFNAGNDYGQLDEDVTLIMIKSKFIAESIKTWFNFMWDTLPEPNLKNKPKLFKETSD